MIGWWLLLALLLTPVASWLLRAMGGGKWDASDKLRGRRLLSPQELAEIQADAPPDESSPYRGEGELDDEEEQS